MEQEEDEQKEESFHRSAYWGLPAGGDDDEVVVAVQGASTAPRTCRRGWFWLDILTVVPGWYRRLRQTRHPPDAPVSARLAACEEFWRCRCLCVFGQARWDGLRSHTSRAPPSWHRFAAARASRRPWRHQRRFGSSDGRRRSNRCPEEAVADIGGPFRLLPAQDRDEWRGREASFVRVATAPKQRCPIAMHAALASLSVFLRFSAPRRRSPPVATSGWPPMHVRGASPGQSACGVAWLVG